MLRGSDSSESNDVLGNPGAPPEISVETGRLPSSNCVAAIASVSSSAGHAWQRTRARNLAQTSSDPSRKSYARWSESADR